MNPRIPPLIALLLVTAGCTLGGRSPASHYYVLPSPPPVPAAAGPATTLALVPVRLPRYLDHPQIVTLDARGRARLAEFHRWAEPLDTGFTRVLTTALAHHLPRSRIVTLPVRRLTPAWTVALQVHDLQILPDRLRLLAEWRLQQGGAIRRWQRETLDRPLLAADYAAVATGLSALGDELAAHIATALTELTAGSGDSGPGSGPGGTSASP